MKATYTGRICSEGKKHSLAHIVPARLRWPAPCWSRLAISGYEPCFVKHRLKPRSASAISALPIWNFQNARVGDQINVCIETAENWQAAPAHPLRSEFDWMKFVDEDETFPTDEANGILRLWSRYSAPFDVKRFPPERELYRLLGVYQAEGSKSEDAPDFVLSNANAHLLKYIAELIETIGVSRDRMYLEVLFAPGEPPEDARRKYELVNIPITAVRLRSGKGNNAGVLHIHNSGPFRRAFCRALEHVFKMGFPTREAALAFALGWLDGDGTIALLKHQVSLRLAGLENENTLVQKALLQAFQWKRRLSEYQNNKNGTHLVLKMSETADLLDAQAFHFSMNWIRLLIGFDITTAKLINSRYTGPFVRWGLRTTNGDLTEIGRRIENARDRYDLDIEKARQLQTTSPFLFGVKGQPNPFL